MKPHAGQTLGAVLAQAQAASVALVCPEDGASLTREQLAEAVDRLARRLATLGVGRGERVALSLPNGPEIVVALLALARLGAAAAPLNPAYTASEFTFYLRDIRPGLLLLPAGAAPAAREAAAGFASVAELTPARSGVLDVTLDGRTPRAAAHVEEAGPDDVALLLHTSGTTSRPKLVPLLHRNLAATSSAIAAHYGLRPRDRAYCAMPLFHVHGLVATVFASLLAGGSVIVPRRLARRSTLLQLAEHDATWLSASPTVHHMLLEVDGASPPAPAALRFLRSCSSALAPQLMSRVEARFGVPLLEAYGMTEAGHQISSNPLPPAPRLPGSVGVPTGTDVRVVDAEWRPVPAGEAGEFAIRGPGVAPGYLDNEEANAEAFRGGWFRTGDLGTIDGEGYLRLIGRRKEIIVRGGENISPLEVEQTLSSHPAVADAVCFGLPDEKYGETVAAAVVLRQPCSERELVSHCRAELAAFKVPRSIDLVDAIPRTPTGKLQRARMASLLGKT